LQTQRHKCFNEAHFHEKKIYLAEPKYSQAFAALTHEANNLKKTFKTACILILLVASLPFLSLLHVKGETEGVRFTITSTVTYSNKSTTNVWNLTGEDYSISLFMNNSWQSVSLVENSLPLNTVRTDVDGNLLGFLNFTQLGPGQNVTYTVKYNAISKPRPLPTITEEQSQTLTDINQTLKDRYCKGEGPWLTNNTLLMALAHNLASHETRVLTIVKNFVGWIADNINYDSEEVPRYPNETVNGYGDCDDQAILLITLCRIVGIPAYLQVGCIFQFGGFQSQTYWKDGLGRAHVTSVLRQIGWHGWAIVYIPPWGWLPADLTYVPIDPNLNDPLNAIRGAAVTGQDVIQYMNISRTDYVGASRSLRDFVRNSDFFIYMEDEMEAHIDFENILEFIKLVVVGALVITGAISVSLATVFVYRWKKIR